MHTPASCTSSKSTSESGCSGHSTTVLSRFAGSQITHLDVVRHRPEQVGQERQEDQVQEAAVVPPLLGFGALGVEVEPRAAVRVPAQGPHHAGRHPVQEQRRDLHTVADATVTDSQNNS